MAEGAMFNPQDLPRGCARVEPYVSSWGCMLYQLDYRHADGELFSCCRKSETLALMDLMEWLKKKEGKDVD